MMISAPVELHKAFNENLRKKCTDGNMEELLRESIELHELDQEKEKGLETSNDSQY